MAESDTPSKPSVPPEATSDAPTETPAPDAPAADTSAMEPAVAASEAPSKPPVSPKATSEVPTAPTASADPAASTAAPAGAGWIPLAVVIGLSVVFFFLLPPLSRVGLWDPYELQVADLARRMAVHLHGATALALDGVNNTLPHLNDLGRPQLPFTSVALGFKFFGLQEWAGRAPLALWGVLGAVATYGFVARLVDRRAGVFSAVALVTMPHYFVEARTMLGDIVTMSAFAMAFGGLAVATFDRRDDGASAFPVRLGWLVVALLGLVAGFYTRGALLSVAVPLLGVGITYALVLANGPHRFDALAHLVGTLSVAFGVVFAWLGLSALGSATSTDLDPLVGAMIRVPAKYPTFDFEIGQLASALAPWSAFVPFAFGRLFIPSRAPTDAAFARENAVRTALLVGAGLAFAAHGWMTARTDVLAFAAPALLAAACGVALRDYERGAHPSLAVGVGTVVLLGLVHHEFHTQPKKAFDTFSISGATFPQSFEEQSNVLWWIALGGFAVVVLLTFIERYRALPSRGAPEAAARTSSPSEALASSEGAPRSPFDPKTYLRVLLALRDAWDGMLVLAYFALVAGASIAGLAVWIGTRKHMAWANALRLEYRAYLLDAWWIVAFVPPVIVFGALFWCDVWLWAFEGARPFSRASVSRGFEPFENLAASIKGGRLRKTLPDFVAGRLAVSKDALDDGVGLVALFILGPLLYLQVPGLVFAVLAKAGMKPLAALAFALPSGVAFFLALGALGDLLRGSRAGFLLVAAAAFSGVLCFSYYPVLANQLSPKEVIETYERIHREGEPLGVLGVTAYGGGRPTVLKNPQAAYDWLTATEPGARRFLALRAEELPRMNRTYRERVGNGKNLPVLDARSSQILLVASSLHGDEKNQSPLESIVLDETPDPQRKLDANLEDKIEVLGYDIVNAKGKRVDFVSTGQTYHMKTYFKVLSPLRSDWEMFIHIDGNRKRHNGDHKPCGGKYPPSLWTTGDILADDYEFKLDPSFSPGDYTVYFGLFAGDTRMKVTEGPSDKDNRVNGGTIRVR